MHALSQFVWHALHLMSTHSAHHTLKANSSVHVCVLGMRFQGRGSWCSQPNLARQYGRHLRLSRPRKTFNAQDIQVLSRATGDDKKQRSGISFRPRRVIETSKSAVK